MSHVKLPWTFTICTALISKLETFPKGISDRLMTLHIALANNTHLMIISAYAPTMTYAEEDKEAFYQLLSNTIHATLKNDVLLGEFSACIGSNCTTWPSMLGPHGKGKENTNRLPLLTLCSEEELTITNMLF